MSDRQASIERAREQIAQDLREYAEAIDKDRGFKTGATDTMRAAAWEIGRLAAALADAEQQRDNDRAELERLRRAYTFRPGQLTRLEAAEAALADTRQTLRELEAYRSSPTTERDTMSETTEPAPEPTPDPTPEPDDDGDDDE